MSGFKPDSMAIVAQEFRAKLKQDVGSHFVSNQRNFIELKVFIGSRRGFEKGSYSVWNVCLGKGRMQQQIAPVLEIAAIDAQGTAISDCRPDRFILLTVAISAEVARNSCGVERNKEIRQWSGPSSRRLALETDSRDETNSERRRFLLGSFLRQQPASLRAMRMDCCS